jgi:Fe2+ or Zn2+ uptake regulation protein
MTPSREQIRDRLREYNLRCTRQRELVYGALASTTTHPTAEELYSMVRREDEGTSLATIYNTLEALTRVGLASRIPSVAGGGACRYDACTGPHVHVVTDEGRVMDVPYDLSQRLLGHLPREVLEEMERRMGIAIERVSVQVEARALHHADAV